MKESTMKHAFLAVTLSLSLWNNAYALSLPAAGSTLPPAPFMAASDAASYDFEGILELSNCSGSLVRFDDSSDSDPAMALTNGHCVKMIPPGTALINQSSSRTFTVLGANGSRLGTVHARKLLYATMTKTDMGLYQLSETYQDLSSRYHTEALTLARETPSAGLDIDVISGYWKRGYSCHIEAIIYNVKEEEYVWQNSLRYSRPGCDTIGGTSGSPVLASGTRNVVAVNNTGNESGAKCTTNNPCEIDKNGKVTYQKGYSYAQQTYWLYSCRDGQGNLDFSAPGCALPR